MEELFNGLIVMPTYRRRKLANACTCNCNYSFRYTGHRSGTELNIEKKYPNSHFNECCSYKNKWFNKPW